MAALEISTFGWLLPPHTSGDLTTLWGNKTHNGIIHPKPSFSDEVVWIPEEHGNFTLNSAYAVVLNLGSQDAIRGPCVV